ncbi:hypothetical protein ACIO14_15260 [Nocardia fluminea]|uniref:TRADD-N-associated membrane domain-containing protein n=1 Tax=Nocardia fluminea TaxID=134984 RepID=UPI003820EEE5
MKKFLQSPLVDVAWLCLGMVGVIGGYAGYILTIESDPKTAQRDFLPILVISVLLVSIATLKITRRRNLLTEKMAQEALRRSVAGVAGPADLVGLMRVNRSQMAAYEAQARSQGRTSHTSSIIAMTVGLAIIGAGLWIAVHASDASTKYSAAILAAVGTATGGYIARTFITVNTVAQEHVRFYFEQPLVQSYLLSAERIVERMPEADRKRQYELIVATALEQASVIRQTRPLAGPPASEEVAQPQLADAPAADAGLP